MNIRSHFDNEFISILLRAFIGIKDSKIISNRTSSDSLIHINALNRMEINLLS